MSSRSALSVTIERTERAAGPLRKLADESARDE
jgi:hypothetical protein